MNSITVPISDVTQSADVLAALSSELLQFTPQVRKAASYVLENPNDVSVSSIREMAEAASVRPNTLVRMARSIGFDGYEDFRAPFREEIRRGVVSFPDRARWLQSLGQSGKLGGLYRDMVDSAIRNIEESFAGIDIKTLQAAARAINKSRQVFTLGVGVNSSNAKNFTYLASTGMTQFHAIPRSGSTPADDLAWADQRDVLIAITLKPFRSEVVEAFSIAKEQGVQCIGISDSPISPIITGADHGFVVSAETPQFFPSSVSTIALLETILSFAIAIGPERVVERVKTFHDRRHQLGLYHDNSR
ncbi:silent information regulator protein Sir2 [Chromatiales bacterium (ex Bugula neritina AB1)]|nr:silent information regulator protein Sir2 [Chromatiales bacterium (ex Bugula neritina AB1)]